jgi:hypothetical protein
LTDYFEAWIRAYAGTLLIEVPILSGWLWPELGRGSLFWGVLASSLTHPVLWFLWPQWGPAWLWIGSAEICIWLFEGAVYAYALRDPALGWAWRRGIALSGLANGASLGAGLLLMHGSG